jgi:lantibiotic modifying enzyme
MGLALIEVGVRYRHPDWIAGGLAAFRYEDQLYDAERGNWPDLREFATVRGMPDSPKRFPSMIAWCHGAAGVGLARLRAFQILPEHRPELLISIERAIRATANHLTRLPADSDASPCHGRAGLAETLVCASAVLDERQYSDQVRRMWARLLRNRSCEDEWPVGIASGRNNPSLMLGNAGIGYALVRAANPYKVSSILVIDPDL